MAAQLVEVVQRAMGRHRQCVFEADVSQIGPVGNAETPVHSEKPRAEIAQCTVGFSAGDAPLSGVDHHALPAKGGRERPMAGFVWLHADAVEKGEHQ